jgi:hypothetical protein
MIPEIIKSKRTGDHTTAVEKLVSEIVDAKISLENYKEWSDKIFNMDQVIVSQIENSVETARNYIDQHNEINKSDSVIQAKETGVVPIELYTELGKAYSEMKDIITWKFLECEMFKNLSKKQVYVLETASVFELKKDALQEFREQQRGMLDFMKEVLTNKMAMVDDKFLNALDIIQKQNKTNQMQFAQLISSMLDKTNNEYVRILEKAFDKKVITGNETERILRENSKSVDGLKNRSKQLVSDGKFITGSEDEEAEMAQKSFDNKAISNSVKEEKKISTIADSLLQKVTQAKMGTVENSDIKKDFEMSMPEYPDIDGDRVDFGSDI